MVRVSLVGPATYCAGAAPPTAVMDDHPRSSTILLRKQSPADLCRPTDAEEDGSSIRVSPGIGASVGFAPKVAIPDLAADRHKQTHF